MFRLSNVLKSLDSQMTFQNFDVTFLIGRTNDSRQLDDKVFDSVNYGT